MSAHTLNQAIKLANIAVRQDTAGRYCINDLHEAAVTTGAKRRTTEPGKFLASSKVIALVDAIKEQRRAFPDVAENTQNLGVLPTIGDATPATVTLNLGNAPAQVNPVAQSRGRTGGTYVCRQLVYAYAAWISPKLACININEFPHNSEQLSSRLAIFSVIMRNAPQPLEAHNIDFFVIVVSRPGHDFFYLVQVHLFILSVR